jgi:hypothetical protein
LIQHFEYPLNLSDLLRIEGSIQILVDSPIERRPEEGKERRGAAAKKTTPDVKRPQCGSGSLLADSVSIHFVNCEMANSKSKDGPEHPPRVSFLDAPGACMMRRIQRLARRNRPHHPFWQTISVVRCRWKYWVDQPLIARDSISSDVDAQDVERAVQPHIADTRSSILTPYSAGYCTMSAILCISCNAQSGPVVR